jgi:hypothetical protein
MKVKSRRLASREKRKTQRKKGEKEDKREGRKDGGGEGEKTRQPIENPKKSSGPTKDISPV